MHPDASMDTEEKTEIRKLTDALKGQVRHPSAPLPVLEKLLGKFTIVGGDRSAGSSFTSPVLLCSGVDLYATTRPSIVG